MPGVQETQFGARLNIVFGDIAIAGGIFQRNHDVSLLVQHGRPFRQGLPCRHHQFPVSQGPHPLVTVQVLFVTLHEHPAVAEFFTGQFQVKVITAFDVLDMALVRRYFTQDCRGPFHLALFYAHQDAGDRLAVSKINPVCMRLDRQ